ncbi:MAG: dTDP-4-dehydrorhamnose 3,5-epimerase [Anaerolineaceae bacterium]|nr:dTDP-4-dehydrorhamnose 3,5-epimerase [Anaerolineaceae bacterium]|tara:strand:- start:8847 stop:9383 length:537 start_codon:yes stop_codon:yes gene_type:complete
MKNLVMDSKIIEGVQHVQFDSYKDERGIFRETFRAEWFPQVDWRNIQANRSDSDANVLRGLHYHHNQYDYWLTPRGHIRVALCDLRTNRSTFLSVEIVEMGGDIMKGLLIPPGVAHGFVTLTEATVNYIVSNYYDGKDEYGVAWNDPELGVDWKIDDPQVSLRDQNNPLFSELDEVSL